MGIVKDIIDTAKNVFQKTSDISDKVSKYNKRSFARGANEQTFQFPCMISDSIPIDMATTITRNLDRVYASFVQIYLSANGVIDLNYIRNPRQFVAQYQNMFNLESANDGFTESEQNLLNMQEDYYKEFYNGKPAFYLDKNEEKGFMFTVAESVSNQMIKNMREGMKESLSIYDTSGLVNEASNRKLEMIDGFLDSLENQNKEDAVKVGLDATRNEQTAKLLERDIKKLNDMQPYAMDLKLLATKGDTAFSQYINYTVGVKTTLHLAKSDVLISNIFYVLKNRNPMFNFIRWTTGELSLLKDIILNLDEMKFDMNNRNDKTGRMLSTLKRLKKQKIKVNASGLSRIAPFATIVISNYEYNELLRKYGFDLKNVVFARKVMEELFLMCLIIADEGTQTIDMLLDGSNAGFQTYSLETLQREVTMNSNKLGQELTRMLGGSR